MDILNAYIYPFERRRELVKHPSFSQVEEIWQELNTVENTGNLDYLLKQAISEKEGMLKLSDWISYYFDSGIKRSLGEKTPQDDIYCGRTLEELYELSKQLKEATCKKGLALHGKGALNIVYTEVIDRPFEQYVRVYRSIPILQNHYPAFVFEHASPYDSMNYAVDLIVKNNDVMVAAIQVRPFEKINSEAKKEMQKEKHELFKMLYDVPVKDMAVDMKGVIRNMPLL